MKTDDLYVLSQGIMLQQALTLYIILERMVKVLEGSGGRFDILFSRAPFVY
jgi:hypothetical protein